MLLFILIAQVTVGNRAGRIEPRAVKRRPKPFPLLMKPREEVRQDIRIHGHPKKLKCSSHICSSVITKGNWRTNYQGTLSQYPISVFLDWQRIDYLCATSSGNLDS